MNLELTMPCRVINAFNREWNVPRHVNPVPHGWQVRFSRQGESYYSKSFSNTKFGSPEAAFDAAIDDVIDQLGSRFRTEELSRKGLTPPNISFSTTGGRGRWKNTGLTASIHLVTHNGKYKHAHRHIGTINSINQEKVDNVVKGLIADWYWVSNRVSTMGVDNLMEVSPPANSVDEMPSYAVIPQINVEQLKARYF